MQLCLGCESRVGGDNGRRGAGEEFLRLYRVNKLDKVGGAVVKKKDVLAGTDKEAVQRAADSADCPVCDVMRDGERVGSIV